MQPLRYSINVTLDGCCDHRVMLADEDLHRQTVKLAQDVLGSDMMVNRYAEAFSGPPIDDVQRAECAAIKQSIDRKIITPYMVFSFRTEPDAGLGQELARVCFKQRRGNWLILLP